jgi:lipoprotein NlpD
MLLAACSTGGNYAPVDDRERTVYQPQDHYIVSRGETLYSIAWRYGIDFKTLAHTNAIASPYTIYPGQRLRLKASSVVTSLSPANSSKVVKTTTKTTKAAKPQITNSSAQNSSSSTPSFSPSKGYPFRWEWPSSATLSKRFSLSGKVHKGIDLKGKLREPVRAANSGTVVYAGSGLVGYGKLLIIKHDDRYLSAYGHNNRLLVAEGEKVKVGQVIAEMGNSGADTVKLHFEIRRDGKPINPLKVLPKRT